MTNCASGGNDPMQGLPPGVRPGGGAVWQFGGGLSGRLPGGTLHGRNPVGVAVRGGMPARIAALGAGGGMRAAFAALGG
jgi:hypothetical protein